MAGGAGSAALGQGSSDEALAPHAPPREENDGASMSRDRPSLQPSTDLLRAGYGHTLAR